MLDRKLIKYVGLEIDPNKAIEARNKGLPVFYGDIGRQEVAEAFNVGKATAVIVCIADKAMANRAVIALRRWYPDLKIFARAADADHANRLQTTLDVAAMVPILPEDNLLLTLPFGGAVLRAMGSPAEEVNAILETKRKEVLTGKNLDDNESQMTLFQLGIDPAENMKEAEKAKLEKEKKEDKGDGDSTKEEKKEKKEEDEDSIAKLAAARVDETREKSPFVAQVIGDVCPESKEIECEGEECDIDEDEVMVAPALEVVDIEGETTIITTGVDVDSTPLSNTEERNTTDVNFAKAKDE